MKKYAVIFIGVMLFVTGTTEAAIPISSFQDMIFGVGEAGVFVSSMHMDIDYGTGELDNLMTRNPDTGEDSIVDEAGVWRLGLYEEEVSGILSFGAFANNDNWVADSGPAQAGWLDGYAYDSVFATGESPDGVLLVFDPDGGQMALEYSSGAILFDTNTTQYWLDVLELDGLLGDASTFVFSFASGADVRIPEVVIVPEPVTLTLLVVGGLVALRRRRSWK